MFPNEENKEHTYQEKFDKYYKEFREERLRREKGDKGIKTVGFNLGGRKLSETRTVKDLSRNKAKHRRKKRKMVSVDDTNSGNTTMYHFTTPNQNFNTNAGRELPKINKSLNYLESSRERITDRSIKLPSKNMVLNYGSEATHEGSVTGKFGKLPKLPERYKAKKSSISNQKLTSHDILNMKNENFVSQQLTLDPNALIDAAKEAMRENKNLSFNIPDTHKLRDTTSDRSEAMSKRAVSVKSIPMPKVSPFTKSIPIKKYGVKLFDEEDEYLCKCFKTMCAQNAGENIRNFRLNRVSFKNYLSKRYNNKIAETIVC